MKDDTLQFVFLWMAMPWFPVGFFGFELYEASLLTNGCVIAAALSIVAGFASYKSYRGIRR